MNHIKHIGIYVRDIALEKAFYINCFDLIPIVNDLEDSGELYDELTKRKNTKVNITKLITEYGSNTRIGEMIELIQIKTLSGELDNKRHITDYGLSHVSFQVNDIELVLQLVSENKGRICTKIYDIGKRRCCFIEDPEGNAIELIE